MKTYQFDLLQHWICNQVLLIAGHPDETEETARKATLEESGKIICVRNGFLTSLL